MKNFKLLFGLYIVSSSFLFTSCSCGNTPASFGFMDITADSKKHDINANRSILVKKDIENKEYRIELIFSPGCEQIGKKEFAFILKLGGRPFSPQKKLSEHYWDVLRQLTLYKEDRTEVVPDDNLLVSNTSVFFLSYKKMDEVYATKFNDETFEPFQIVELAYWEGKTSGGNIYLNGENNNYDEHF